MQIVPVPSVADGDIGPPLSKFSGAMKDFRSGKHVLFET